MALNFPNSPTVGQIYTDSTSGFSYEWDGTVWKSYSPSSSSNIRILDDISGSFNNSTQTFPLTINGTALTPATSQSLIITLGGVTQKPGTDYNVSSSNIVFTTAPQASLTFSGISLGPAVPVTTIPDGTTTEGALNIAGNLSVLGFTTTKNLYATGVVTATSFVGNLTGSATGLSGTPNIVVGIATATSAVIGSGVTINATGVNATGFVTATEYDITGSTNTFNSSGLSVGVITANDYGGNFILDSYLFN